MKAGLVAAALVCAHAMATPALAQETDKKGADHSEAAKPPAVASDSSSISEIIVTATKQSQPLQKTPAAVSVVTADEVVSRQLLDVRGLDNFMPSIRTNVEQATATQLFVRGVGKQVDLGHVPDAVGLSIDGLNLPQHASWIGLFDVRDIQVLPGPQGTLYGSSAIGGVINITTNKPTHTLETSVLLEGGNYANYHATLVQNIPLNESWAVRLAYNGAGHGPYDDNGTYADTMNEFRVSVLYDPSASNFSALVSATLSNDNFKPEPAQPYPYIRPPYSFPAYEAATAFFSPPNGLAYNGGRGNEDTAAITGKFDYRLGDINISYIPGFLYANNPTVVDTLVGGFLNQFKSMIHEYTNELRFSNAGESKLHWLAGLYQSHQSNQEFSIFGPYLSGYQTDTQTDTYAAYGQATYSVTNSTRLTGGLRYSVDSTSVDNAKQNIPFGGGAFVNYSFSHAWPRLNWKVGLEQDLATNSLFYATIQSGFNPGTYDGDYPVSDRLVEPQSMIAYTVGVKNQFFDKRLTLNLEGYVYNYENRLISAPNLATGAEELLNAPRSRITGFELDTAYRLGPDTKLHASVGYLNAKFLQFKTGSATGTPVDYAGSTLSFSPELSGDVGLDHRFDLPNGAINLKVDAYLSSFYWITYDHPAGFRQPGFSKTDLSLMYSPTGQKWQIGFWMKNAENNAVVATGGDLPGRAYPGVVFIEPPRTFGGRIQVKW
jgi:iron complex outermembrane receptor protein